MASTAPAQKIAGGRYQKIRASKVSGTNDTTSGGSSVGGMKRSGRASRMSPRSITGTFRPSACHSAGERPNLERERDHGGGETPR